MGKLKEYKSELEQVLAENFEEDPENTEDAWQNAIPEDFEDMDPKQTRNELIFGCVAIGILLLAGMIFVNSKTAYLLGDLIGTAIAVGMCFHLYYSVENAINKDQKGATGYMRLMAILRAAVMFAAISLSVYFNQYINPISLFLSVLSLKVAALLQPAIHKYILRKGG